MPGWHHNLHHITSCKCMRHMPQQSTSTDVSGSRLWYLQDTCTEPQHHIKHAQHPAVPYLAFWAVCRLCKKVTSDTQIRPSLTHLQLRPLASSVALWCINHAPSTLLASQVWPCTAALPAAGAPALSGAYACPSTTTATHRLIRLHRGGIGCMRRSPGRCELPQPRRRGTRMPTTADGAEPGGVAPVPWHATTILLFMLLQHQQHSFGPYRPAVYVCTDSRNLWYQVRHMVECAASLRMTVHVHNMASRFTDAALT